ncbi:hypothetical protein ACW0TQ_08650 [Oceanobacillus sp. M60]
MFAGIIAGIIIVIIAISLLWPIGIYLRNFRKRLRKFHIKKLKDNLNKGVTKRNRDLKKDFKTDLIKLKNMFFKFMRSYNKEKFHIIILVGPPCSIIFLVQFKLDVYMPYLINYFILIVFLIGLFSFFLNSGKFSKLDQLDKLSLYFIKLMILFQFLLLFLSALYSNPENYKVLLFTVTFTVIYSLVLVISVLKDFKKRKWFQLFNMIGSIIIIISTLGMAFGAYYFSHNEIFGFFNSNEVDFISNGNMYIALLFLVYKGLLPFYLPLENGQVTLEHPETFILLVESSLGFIINVVIIGIFVSYFSSFFQQEQTEKNEKAEENNELLQEIDMKEK